MILAKAQARALDAEIARKDQELAAKIELEREKLKAQVAKDNEAAEAKAAELQQKLMDFRIESELKTAQIAEIHAKITSLNRADKNQSGPAEDSSADEFATARADIGGKPGKAKPGQAKAKPKAKPKEKLAA